MKNLLLVVAVAFLGSCATSTSTDAKAQSGAQPAATGAAECTVLTDCTEAKAGCEAAASCTDKASCCAEAKAAGKECADCVKP